MKQIIFFLFLPLFSYSQSNDDSLILSKYSYFVSGFETLEIKNDTNHVQLTSSSGTCFFIRSNNELYLVTAKHVLTGCDSSKPLLHPNKMGVWLTGQNLTESQQLYINTGKIRDTAICMPLYDDPDIIVLKVKNKTSLQLVNSVEDFISTNPIDTKGVIFYGYPDNGGYMIFQKPPLDFRYLKENSYSIHDGMIYTDTHKEDSINYLIYPNEWDYRVVHGFSGSPTFFKNKETNKWQLLGVTCGGGANTKRWVICKINLVLSRISTSNSL